MDITVSHIFNSILMYFYFRKILNAKKTRSRSATFRYITLRNLRNVTSAESTNMENQRETLQPIP